MGWGENVRSLEIKYFWLLTPAEIPLLALAGLGLLLGDCLASLLSSAPMGEGDGPGEAVPFRKENPEQWS